MKFKKYRRTIRYSQIIGYGNIQPQTEAGKIFAVFYALIGIPMMLVLIGGVGRSLASLAERSGCSPNSCCCVCVKGLVMALLGLSVVITIPALMFYFVEKWSFGDSWWFAFFTVSTVGLGEVPGKNVLPFFTLLA